MPQPIPLQDAAVYGPIRSRRLGNSLGINVLPVSHKVCSSNCVYCQYGWTPSPVVRPEGRNAPTAPTGDGGRLKRAPELLADIEEAFRRHARNRTPVDCITLAGNGEPTLHPDLEELVIGIKRLRDAYFPTAPVGILSDATQIARPHVRRALASLDQRCMKFDAADEATWRRINDPLVNVNFQAMIEALKALPDVVLQSMFIQGSYDNTDEPHLCAWIAAVGSIKPRSVQVYTVDRPTAADGIQPVPREQLQEIADRLAASTGIHAEVFD
ncbi:MAG: radical SAM protein [Candidatus Omnitrophica bacterium]|nr:radical SAM protein [Candidatus Omnitrophota bacterium]MBI3020913.1 radical SAM protein [Candidatus Omnitrophota bacterium]